MKHLVIDSEKAAQDTPLPTYDDPQSISPVPDQSISRRRKIRVVGILVSILSLWLGVKLIGSYLHFQFQGYHESNVADLLCCLFQRGRSYHILRKHAAVSATEWPVPPDVMLVDCAGWVGNSPPSWWRCAFREPFTSYAAFEVPIASDKLFLLARGMAAGSVNVRYGSDHDVKIAVEARYRSHEALDSVKVCTVTRGEGENGLGIFGPKWLGGDVVQFEVTLYLPNAKEGSVLEVKNFETDVPLFAHDISDLEGSVHFDSFKLKSINMPIVVRSLAAGNAIVQTRNSPIRGTFNVTSSLKLLTANAPIDASVSLYNDHEKDIADLLIRTSNGHIKGALHLKSATETGGKFKVFGSTANAPVYLAFYEAPVSSVLLLDAHTSLAPAHIGLHKTYEGTFDLATSLQRANVIWSSRADDPAGKGRERKVEVIVNGALASGSARWSDDDSEKLLGYVNVDTSSSPLILRL